MYTEYFGPIERDKLDKCQHLLEGAARKLQQGGVVALPTETVYGLSCTVLNESALKRIFQIKGREESVALPVHVANMEQLKFVVQEIPMECHVLAKRFLPGPLTIILKKRPTISSIITGGKDTIAIRIPADPITRRVIELTGCPLAVPSANKSGKPSSVRASHVLEDFNGHIDAILDGGECQYGMESTVISLEDPFRPTIYRNGVVSQREIEEALNRKVTLHPSALAFNGNSSLSKLRSAIRLFSSWEEIQIYLKLSSKSKRMIMSQEKPPLKEGHHFELNDKNLYDGLRIADRDGYAEVIVLCSPELKKNTLLLTRLKQIART